MKLSIGLLVLVIMLLAMLAVQFGMFIAPVLGFWIAVLIVALVFVALGR